MIDIDKLEELPMRMSRKEYLTNKFVDMYNVKRFDSPWCRSKNEDKYYFHLNIILKSHIGKPVDLAFSKYCKKVMPYEQKYFWKEFENRRYYQSDYLIDKNKNIQVNPNKGRKKSEQIIFCSHDIKYGWYDIDSKAMVDTTWGNWRIYHQPEKFVRCVIQGYEKVFESKKDPEYKRLMAEKIKLRKLNQKRRKKEEKQRNYCFLTSKERALKENQKEDVLKRDRKGFDEESFKGLEYHGQKRKLKQKQNGNK